MRSGRMTHKAEIYAPGITQSSTGERQESLTLVSTVMAELKTPSSREYFAADGIQAEEVFVLKIRRTAIGYDSIVRVNGFDYQVIKIDPVVDRRVLEVTIKRRPE